MLTYKIFLNTDMTIKDVISSGNLVQYSWNNISLNVYIPKAIYETTPSISNAVSITFAQTKENGETVITNNARLYEFSYVKDNVIVGNIEYVLLTRQMPQQMTLYFGNTQMFQINHLVISDNEIISFAQSPFQRYEVFQASNTQEIHYEPSNVDELQADINRAKEDIESLKTYKQDKASTYIHVRTTSAVDEDPNHFTTSVESGLNVLSVRTDDLEIDNKKNKEDIEELKSAIINNFTPLGKMTGNTAEPTLEQINAWLVEQGITNVELGDLIIYVGQVPGVNTNYKCIYSVDGWFWYETTELETASNSNMGVVKGNGNDTHANEAIDIQNGEIQGIKVKDMNGTQRYLKGYINDLEDNQSKILDGTTSVPMANKSKNDEAGNDIQATYQTKTLGATKQYVKDYALSKAFNDMNYINFSANSNTIEPTYHGGTKTLTISNIGDVKLFSATYHNDVYEYSLSQNNVFELHLPIMLNVAKTTKLKAVIKLDNGIDTPTTIGTADSSNIEFVADSFTLVTINGAFTSLQTPVKITPTSSLIVDVYIFNDETTTFRVQIANALYQPGSFTLTIPYQTIQIVQGGAVGQQYVHTICTYNETAQADLGVGYVFDLSGIDLVEGTEHKFIANVPLRETYIRIAKDDTEIDFVDGNGAQPQYNNTNHLLVYPVNATTMKIIFSAYYTNDHFVLIEPNLEQYAKLNDLTTLATKTELTNLSNDVDSRLDQQDATIQGLGNLEPSGVDTSTNILAFTEDKGIYVGSDTGHWYYWNGTQYADGGVYQATEIPDGSISYDKTNFVEGIVNILDLTDPDNIVKSGYFCTDVGYPNGTANSSYAFVRCEVKPNTQYTLKAWFFFAELDSNETFIRQTNLGQDNLINYTFTTQATTKYILFNTSPSALNTSMVIEGDVYPEQYYSFGEHYLFKGEQMYAKKDEVESVEKYYVGATRQYTTFTQCIRALANNTNKKIIYIDGGTYDIFNEIGGSTYALSITQGTSWVDCNDIIPDNTTIIGLGDVIFNFMPTAEQIGNIADDLLSPINVQGNVTIENITINADNCRYCIHDETGDGYENSVKNYKNVRCYKYASGGLGKPQAYASGFYKGVSFNFENCYFQSPVACISFHDRNFNGGNININNCAFVSTSGSSSNRSISFGNVAYSQKHHKAYINNCYISSKILIYAENGNEHINSFDIQVIGCSSPTVELQEVLTTNIYPPKVYN